LLGLAATRDVKKGLGERTASFGKSRSPEFRLTHLRIVGQHDGDGVAQRMPYQYRWLGRIALCGDAGVSHAIDPDESGLSAQHGMTTVPGRMHVGAGREIYD
jgi:hypothetical protein